MDGWTSSACHGIRLFFSLVKSSKKTCVNQDFNPSIQTNSDFVEAATRGAVAVIDGNVMPLNPGEEPHMQMFIWNNLFFSLGFDISEHYRPLGGNTAAHAAALCDLRGAQVKILTGIPARVVRCLGYIYCNLYHLKLHLVQTGSYYIQ